MLASLLSLLIYFIKQKKYQWFSIVVFVMVNLVLVLQVLPFGEVLFADRYAYIPIIGLAWMLGFIFTKVKTQSLAICLIVIGVFSAFSFSRASAWKSAITLYEDILKKYPEQYVALNSAGVECMFLNEDEKALEYFNKAVRIAPRNYKGFYNRGLLYLKNNKPELALKSFNQTLALYQYGKAYTARASAYYALGDIPKALNDANYAIGMDKNNAKAHFVLGNCLSDLNKLDDAISEYNTCITLNKEESDFYFKRAITYGKKQNFNFCLSDLVVCLALNPNYYEAYYWKGVVKINLKQNPCEDFKIAAEHNYEPAVNAFNKYCR
jgi:tetratricopeptide (TPR) repeat protein